MRNLWCAFLIIWSVTLAVSVPSQSESEADGKRLFNEAVDLGKIARLDRDLKAVEEKFKAALTVFEQGGDERRSASAALALGRFLFSLRRYDDALAYSNRALELYTRTRCQEGQAEALESIGEIYKSKKDISAASEHFQRALTVSRELSDRMREQRLLCLIGQLMGEQARNVNDEKLFGQAVEKLEQSLAICRDLGNRLEEAETLWRLCSVYTYWSRWITGSALFKRAEELDKRAHELVDLHCREALESAKEANDKSSQAKYLFWLGRNAFPLEWKRSLQHFEDAVRLYREVNDKRALQELLSHTCMVYNGLGLYWKTLEIGKERLLLATELDDRRGQSYALTELGESYKGLGQYDKAIECYWKALEVVKEGTDHDSRVTRASALSILSSLYSQWGDHDKAIALRNEYTALATTSDEAFKKFHSNMWLGILYAAKGDRDQCEQHFLEAIRL